MNRLTRLIRYLEERTARPLAEAGWRRRRGTFARWTLGLAALLAAQTAMVHHPDYLINALYHNRRANNIELRAMSTAERSKLLERLCLSASLFEKGGIDPYKIPDAETCAQAARERLIPPRP